MDKEDKPKLGRPEIDFDWNQFESLCRCQATLEEMAAVMRLPRTTIESKVKKKYKDTFSEVVKRFAGEIQVSLRRRQIQAALDEKKANNTMLIWCGKQYLGQREPKDDTKEAEQAHTFMNLLGSYLTQSDTQKLIDENMALKKKLEEYESTQ